jgi:thiamine-phosphate pyrophosphorylase
MMPSFDLILISAEQDLKDEVKALVQMFNPGLQTYHLRKPHWGIEQMRLFLKDIPNEFQKRIVLHSHFELAKEFEVKGIHLNEENKALPGQFSSYKIISASFHSLKDLKANSFSYEYVFLSPVFDSISKAGYKARFDLKLLQQNLREMKLQNPAMPKVIALGGINAQNILSLQSAGFSGAAVLGAVWLNENPVNAFLEIKTIISEGT